MEIIKQLLLILGACFAGEVISALLPITFPSSVIAMMLLFALLLSGALKEVHISKVGDFFLQNMSVFFLPSAIGILEHWNVISSVLVQFLLICLLTTLITFAATAYTVMFVQKLMKGGSSHD